MTYHENQISKNIIKNQEHDLIGLKKVLVENEKSCKITRDKIDQYSTSTKEYIHSSDIYKENLFHYKIESDKRSSFLKSDFSERSS